MNPKAALLDASGRGGGTNHGHFANAATLFRRFPVGVTPQRHSRFHLSTEKLGRRPRGKLAYAVTNIGCSQCEPRDASTGICSNDLSCRSRLSNPLTYIGSARGGKPEAPRQALCAADRQVPSNSPLPVAFDESQVTLELAHHRVSREYWKDNLGDPGGVPPWLFDAGCRLACSRPPWRIRSFILWLTARQSESRRGERAMGECVAHA
jgi:hypothetical protein